MHLSKDFFVNASEQETRQHILQLPACINNIKFIEENPVSHSFKFIYERPADTTIENYSYIDVSLLPLNIHQTRITLRGSYNNNNLFYKDFKVSNALYNFESAIHAVVKGNVNEFEPQQIKMSNPRNINIALALALLAGTYFLIKNWFV